MPRPHARPLFHELDLVVNDAEDFRDRLAQIASGRHSLLVFDAYELNESITLSIEGPNDLPRLRLRARVMDVERPHTETIDWIDLYRLTLEIEHPSDSIRALVDYLLSLLPAEDSRPMLAQTSPSIGQVRSSPRCDLSAIELNCPEMLHGLIAGWGDARAFDVLFRDLTFGDIGEANQWPADVWDEPNFLQDIHDRAYGIPATRRIPLPAGRHV